MWARVRSRSGDQRHVVRVQANEGVKLERMRHNAAGRTGLHLATRRYGCLHSGVFDLVGSHVGTSASRGF